jgi:hypothetical protein
MRPYSRCLGWLSLKLKYSAPRLPFWSGRTKSFSAWKRATSHATPFALLWRLLPWSHVNVHLSPYLSPSTRFLHLPALQNRIVHPHLKEDSLTRQYHHLSLGTWPIAFLSQSKLLPRCVGEMMFQMIHCPPLLDFTINNRQLSKSFEMSYDAYIAFIMFFRLYVTFRLFDHFTIWTDPRSMRVWYFMSCWIHLSLVNSMVSRQIQSLQSKPTWNTNPLLC